MGCWGAAGQNTSGLANARLVVTELPAHLWGLVPSVDRAIYLDAAAVGYGWSANATPRADFNFGAENEGEVADRVDALTAIFCELGPLLGLGEVDSLLDPNDPIADGRAKGTRKKPGSVASVSNNEVALAELLEEWTDPLDRPRAGGRLDNRVDHNSGNRRP
jgi:hypothetical protein